MYQPFYTIIKKLPTKAPIQQTVSILFEKDELEQKKESFEFNVDRKSYKKEEL
jgi:hypothetical protein